MRKATFAGVLVGLVAGGLFSAHQVQAYSGTVNGREDYRGYFDNQSETQGRRVFNEGIPTTVNTAAEFINYVKTRYNTGTAQQKTGAAFIIQTMLGRNGAAGYRTVSAADMATWEARVNNRVSAGKVNWNVNYSYSVNSFYQDAQDDDAFYSESDTQSSIVFYNDANAVVYVLKHSCANPVGDPIGLPPVAGTFDLNGAKISNTGVDADGTNSGYGGGTVGNFTNDTVTAAGPTVTRTSTANPFGFNDLPSGTYTVSVSDNQADWNIVGYSICVASSTCNSGYLTKTSSITAGASFSYNFVAGKTYNMRWIYSSNLAKLYGVKIDNSMQPGGYGGMCYGTVAVSKTPCGNGSLENYRFSDDRITTRNIASGVTDTDTENYFSFDNLNGNTRVTARDDNLAWELIGYDICERGAGCTSASLTNLPYRVLTLDSTAGNVTSKYFDFNFVVGKTYDMRWIYRPVVYIDGVKIDNRDVSAGGSTAADYGGNCNPVGVAPGCVASPSYPFSDDAVTISGTTSNNYFIFRDVTPGTIPITVNDDNTDWNILGISICEDNQSVPDDCTSQVLTQTGNIRAYGPGGVSYPFQPGKIYHIRVIYETPEPPPPDPPPGCPSMPNPYQTFTIPDNSPRNPRPPAYSSSPGEVYDETYPSGTTDAVEVIDISTGGDNTPVPPIVDDATYERVTLDYRAYIDTYPYDRSKPSVVYDSYYISARWRSAATQSYGAPYWHDNNSNGTVDPGETYGDPLGYEWQDTGERSTLTFRRTETNNPPTLQPCQNRKFDLTPTPLNASINDAENPTVASFSVQVTGNLRANEAGSKPNLRQSLRVNDVPVEGAYYFRDFNNNLASGETRFVFTVTSIGTATPNKLYDVNEVYSTTQPVSRPPLRYGDKVCFRAIMPKAFGEMNVDSIIQTSTQRETFFPNEKCSELVGNRPYFRVYDGDIQAGGEFETSGVCNSVTNGRLIGQYRSSTRVGAGTELAAFALRDIQEVISADLRSSFPTLESGLSFANFGVTGMGGSFSNRNCVTDYFGTTQFNEGDARRNPSTGTISPGNINVATLDEGEQTVVTVNASGRLKLNMGGSPTALRHTIYVTGNVVIGDNIIYPTGNTTNLPAFDRLPYFTLVVRGDIYIEKQVTQLDGLFIAQRNGGSGGRIMTCRDNNGAYLTPADLPTQCQTKLTVNGAFIADEIYLQRTIGTLSTGVANEQPSSTNIAEVFQGTPEFYIGRPVFKSTSGLYDSIRALPPVISQD